MRSQAGLELASTLAELQALTKVRIEATRENERLIARSRELIARSMEALARKY